MERRFAAILTADEAGTLAALQQFRVQLFAPAAAIADPHGSIVKLTGNVGLGRVFWVNRADARK